MVAFFRQFLVVTLVLLQYASPLVHAHTGAAVVESGLHLYEFESVHSALRLFSMKTAKSVSPADSAIVNVGAGIKQNFHKFHGWFLAQYSSTEIFLDNHGCQIISSVPLLDNCISQSILTANNSRAPPY
jgi:hypothetical protein